MKKLLLLAILPFMISCQDKFNGKDEQSFKTSREKIELNLDKNEKTDLEKAMLLSFDNTIEYLIDYKEPIAMITIKSRNNLLRR